MMRILMVSSEVFPLAKSGGLADAVASLSKALAALGHDVRILIPRYYFIDPAMLLRREDPLGVPMGGKEEWTSVFETSLPGTEVPVYLLEHEALYGRDGIYGTKAETDFGDNAYRFGVLSKAAFMLCLQLGWIPDVIHAHDWPTGLVPAYLRFGAPGAEFRSTVTAFSIHNLGYQGIYPLHRFQGLGLPEYALTESGLKDWDTINLLKAGLSCADELITVSPTYAREIQGAEQGFRLDWLLRERKGDLVGILNGVDYDDWDPATDHLIPHRYDAARLGEKARVKAALQREFGLQEAAHKPLVGMVTRLTEQKGVGELFGPGYGSAWELATRLDAQFVVLGSGEDWCEREIRSLATRLPNFRARVGYDNRTAHMIEAGSDFFLMPSRYEPCGLNQMYSLKYGTLPIVHRTGGLADTVENYDPATGGGTGFMFDDLTPRAIYNTVAWACAAFREKPEHIEAMRRRGMALDFTWKESAKLYEAAYAKAFRDRGLDAPR